MLSNTPTGVLSNTPTQNQHNNFVVVVVDFVGLTLSLGNEQQPYFILQNDFVVFVVVDFVGLTLNLDLEQQPYFILAQRFCCY